MSTQILQPSTPITPATPLPPSDWLSRRTLRSPDGQGRRLYDLSALPAWDSTIVGDLPPATSLAVQSDVFEVLSRPAREVIQLAASARGLAGLALESKQPIVSYGFDWHTTARYTTNMHSLNMNRVHVCDSWAPGVLGDAL